MSDPPDGARERYLGDGLYGSCDGYQFILRAPRSDGDHWVVLDPRTLKAFLDYVKSITSKDTENNGAI